MQQPSKSLTKSQIRRLLRKERGSFHSIARDLGISCATVSGVLRGKSTSARVMELATARALNIQGQIEREAAAANQEA